MNTEQPQLPVRRVCMGATADAVAVRVVLAGQDSLDSQHSQDKELDAALAMTFPASDPVAIDCHPAAARLPPQ
jgi:hypothetical protein